MVAPLQEENPDLSFRVHHSDASWPDDNARAASWLAQNGASLGEALEEEDDSVATAE